LTDPASDTTTIVEQFPQTETVVCYFCGSPDFTRLFCSRDRLHRVPGEYWVVRCDHCGLVYLNPCPSRARMRAHYPPHYVINQFRPVAKNAPLRQRLVAHQLERIDRLKLRRVLAACPLDSHAHVLDVGCNLGTFLAALRDRTGCSVVGLEPAPTPAQYAREHFHLDVRQGCLEDVADSFAPASFDLITLWHVLEHLWAPRRDLQIIRALLKPGGTLIVEVPNFGDPLRRLFGSSWAYVDVPRHLLHFTPRTLRNVLEDAGFAIGSLERDGTFSVYSVTISSLFTLLGLSYEPDLEKSAYAATFIRYATWPLFTLEGLLGIRGLLTAISTPREQALPADPQAHRRAPVLGADA
jgi:2-polyprenyl-3-methyl-5-hydroxy-6-metoxy-1,4-benzoquinol methylase